MQAPTVVVLGTRTPGGTPPGFLHEEREHEEKTKRARINNINMLNYSATRADSLG